MLKKLFIAFLLAGTFCINASATGNIEITETGISVDGNSYTFNDAPFMRSGAAYVPLDEALPACGFTLGWNSDIKGTVCEKDGFPNSVIFPNENDHLVGYGMYHYIHPIINIDGKCFIESNLFSDVVGSDIRISEAIGYQQIADKYRLAQDNLAQFGNIFVLNRDFMFEPTVVSAQSAAEYAGIVNKLAAKIPNVNVYNMLIPDAGEIYAPKSFYCNQLGAFEAVFDRLINVTPVRVADALYSHAGEKIYFRTDHHWTQRGSYYAWKEFMKLKGESVPELSDFAANNRNDFTGSFASGLSDASAVLDNTQELLERFLPIYNVKTNIYDDMYQNEFAASIPLVNAASNDYGSFIYGDCPLTVISGGVPNGKKLVLLKESMGNALATWACNNYETVYVVDIRAFSDGSFDIGEFYNLNMFDDLLIASYPTTIESPDLRNGLALLIGD